MFHPLAPLLTEDAPSLADRAYERLRDAIVDGSLPAGRKLSERSLAAALGISAQPIREALRRLEGEGMIESRPRSGSFVASLNRARLIEMGQMRAALEGVAVSLVARHAGPQGIAALSHRLEAIRAATAQDDPVLLAQANDAFHLTIHGLTGNALLVRTLRALQAYHHISRSRVLSTREERERALEEHAAILARVQARDEDGAEALMRAHTMRSLGVAFPEADAA